MASAYRVVPARGGASTGNPMSSWCCRRRAVAAQGSQLRPLHGGDADGEAGGDDDEDIEREAAEARHRGREAGRRTVAGADQLVAVSLRHGDLAVGALFARAAGGVPVAAPRSRAASKRARRACDQGTRRAQGRRDEHPARRARDHAHPRTRRGALRTGLVLSSGRAWRRVALRSRSLLLPGRCRLGGRFLGRRWGW